jgi:hypothetical protein
MSLPLTLRFFNEHARCRVEEAFPSVESAAAWLDRLNAEFIGCWFFLDREGERLRCDVFRQDDGYRFHPSWVAANLLPVFFGTVKNVGVNPRVREAVAEALNRKSGPHPDEDERIVIHFDAPGGPVDVHCGNRTRLVENLRMWSVTADDEGLFRVNPHGQRIPAVVRVNGSAVPFAEIAAAMKATPQSSAPVVREMSRYAIRRARSARRRSG